MIWVLPTHIFTGRDLKHCVLALSAAESLEEDLVTTNTIGFVVV